MTTELEGEAPVKPGDLLADKYRVERVLGVGGMGVVVAATHEELRQHVAVKFLLPSVLGNEEVVERFLREARAAVQIRSEHVARVIDVGKLESGSPFMVMEYLDGVDLAAALAHGGPMPVQEAVDYVLQACDAIAEAHAAEIVHRDLKPANLFRTQRRDGTPLVKVLDFGISKVRSADTDPSLTKTSSMMGSPYYMSPEQLRSAKTVDHRSDIWSLGVILYELLGGHPPFEAESMPELVAAILTVEPAPVRSIRQDVPQELDAVVQRCLQKDPEQRYATIADLAAALAPFGPAHAGMLVDRVSKVLGTFPASAAAAPATPQDGPVAPDPHGGTVASWGDTKPPVRSRWPALTVGLAAVVLLGAGGAFFAFRSSPTEAAPSTLASRPGSEAVAAEKPPEEGSASGPVITPDSVAEEKDADAGGADTTDTEQEPSQAPAVAPTPSPRSASNPLKPAPAPVKTARPKPAPKAKPEPEAKPEPKAKPKPKPPREPTRRNPLSIDIK